MEGHAISIILILFFLLLMRRRASAGEGSLVVPGDAADLDGDLRRGPGIHARISEQLKLRPEGPLDYASFPRVPFGDGDYYAFGARLFHAGRARLCTADPSIISAAVNAVRSHTIRDWRSLEANLKEVDPLEHRMAVMAAISPDLVTPRVSSLFREVAIRSDNYNAISWGIALGCVSARQPEIESLLVLARHSELTADVVTALLEQSSRFPQLRRRLVDVIPHLYDWGLLYAVLTVINHADAIPPDTARREILVHGMKNGGAMRGDIARVLLEAGWLTSVSQDLIDDDPLRMSVARMIEALASLPEPPGQISRDADGREVVEEMLNLVRPWPDDFAKLMALRGLGLALVVAEDEWTNGGAMLEEVQSLVADICTVDRVSDALNDPETRATALLISAETGMTSLTRQILETARHTLDPLAAEVVGLLGDRAHLAELQKALPEVVDLSRRSTSHGASGGIQWERESQIYAGIVAVMGLLGTRSAIRLIRQGATDPSPVVRGAAMVAMARLQRWTLDADCRTLVRTLLDDPVEGVRERARDAAAYHTMHASLEGTPHMGTLTFTLPMN